MALFTIDADTGVLSFLAAPDFETPGDVDMDNVYEVEVTATEASTGAATAQILQVTVQDVLAAPVVIDMDGDGLEFVGLNESQAQFDMDNDGALERTAWLGGDDALLVFDHDGDRAVTSRSEFVLTDHAPGAKTDLEALAMAFDSNQDRLFTADDAAWDAFGVWQDGNEDGFFDEGEFLSLDEAGIASIDLESDHISSVPADGVFLHGQSVVTFADGTTQALGDVSFSHEELPAIGDVLETGEEGLSIALAEADSGESKGTDGNQEPAATFEFDGESLAVVNAGGQNNGGEAESVVAEIVPITPADVAPAPADASSQSVDAPPALVA